MSSDVAICGAYVQADSQENLGTVIGIDLGTTVDLHTRLDICHRIGLCI